MDTPSEQFISQPEVTSTIEPTEPLNEGPAEISAEVPSGDLSENSVEKRSKECGFFEKNAKAIFHSIDKNGDGFINKAEMTQMMKRRNMPFNTKLVDAIYKQADTSNDYRLNFEEFLKFAKSQDKKLSLIFKRYDVEGRGYLTGEEFANVLRSMNKNINKKEINCLIKKMDLSGDDHISFEEFVNFYHLIPIDDIGSTFNFFEFTSLENSDSPVSVSKLTSGELTPLLMQFSGGVGGIVSRTFTAPFERAKLVAQYSDRKMSTLQNIRMMYRQTGLRSLFQGNLANILKSSPETLIRMSIFYRLKEMISKEKHFPTVEERMLAGGLGGGIANLCVYPLEVVRCRLAVAQHNEYKGIKDCFRKIYAEKGFFGLYRGGFASMLNIIPLSAFDLWMFLSGRDYYIRNIGHYPPTLVLIMIGAFSSLFGQTISYPFSVVRTRLQNQNHLNPEYRGIFDCFHKLVKAGGVSSLWKGIGTVYFKSLPSITCTYVILSQSRKMFLKLGIVVE